MSKYSELTNPDSGTSSEPGGWPRWLAEFGAGAGLWLILAGTIARRAGELGYDPRLTWLYAAALALQLEVLLLPLAAQTRLQPNGTGILGPIFRLWLGGTIAGAILAVADRGAPLEDWLAARAVLLAVLSLIGTIGAVVAAWSERLSAGRLAITFSAILLAGGVFWTGGLPDCFSNLGGDDGQTWTTAAVWLSPGALAAKCLPTSDIALLPRVYNFWLGPVSPYPGRPGLVGSAVYGGLALLMAELAWRGRRWSNRRRSKTEQV